MQEVTQIKNHTLDQNDHLSIKEVQRKDNIIQEIKLNCPKHGPH